MPLHIGGVGFQLVRDMPEAVGKMRLNYGDTPELDCSHPIKRRRLAQGTQNTRIGYHGRKSRHNQGLRHYRLLEIADGLLIFSIEGCPRTSSAAPPRPRH